MEKIVFFRAFEEEDIDAIYQWKNDDELNKMTVGLNRKVCKDDVAKWVKSRMPHNPYEVYWAICANDETKRIIGYAQLTDIHFVNSSANFSGILIGDKDYQDGFACLETYLFIMEYAFERLGLNRLYGSCILGHRNSNNIGKLLLWNTEGVMRQAVFKNGQFYDVSFGAILKEDYFKYKADNLYEMKAILKRLRELKHNHIIKY